MFRLVPEQTEHSPLGSVPCSVWPPGTQQVKKMECCYCGKTFQPDPPRRRVCPVCISRRPAHLRESYSTGSAMVAAAEREKERVRQERRDRVRHGVPNSTNTEKKAVPADLLFVSVGKGQDAAAVWRERNVIPFPGRPLRPRRIRFWPSDGDSAA